MFEVVFQLEYVKIQVKVFVSGQRRHRRSRQRRRMYAIVLRTFMFRRTKREFLATGTVVFLQLLSL